MRIVHIIRSLDPRYGGPPRVVARMAAAHASLGHQVSLLRLRIEPDRDALVQRSIDEVPGHERLHLGTIDPALIGPFGMLMRGWESAFPEADLYYLHGVWDPILPAAARAAVRRGIPYVIRPAGMLTPWSLGSRRFKKRLALALGWRRMLNGALYLQALNREEAETMAPLRLRAPIEVVPNGIFIEEVGELPPRGAYRATHPELGDDPFVLFLSRLHWGKGLDILADAFAMVLARLPDARLVVAGNDAGVGEAFRQQVEALGIAPRVHLVGPTYGAEKVAAHVDACCFVLPSEHEAFSVAITEALACGCPVVISPECHFPEVAEVGAGLIVPRDAAPVAEALERLISDRALGRRMGDAGRQLVRERFTWPEIAARSVGLVEKRLASLIVADE